MFFVATRAVRKLTAHFLLSRFPRNVSLRSAGIGRAIMKVSAQISATRAVRVECEVAVGRVACARLGWVVRRRAALSPNQAFERTRRFMVSTWRADIRRAGYLAR